MVGKSFWTSAVASGVVAFALLVLPVFAADLVGTAQAQGGAAASAPTESEVAEARRIFSVGIRHADRGEWEDAVVCFRQVLEVRQAPPVLFNLGAALVALGEYPEAEPLLRHVADDPTAESTLVERARASLHTMEERGGRLTITLVSGTPSTVVTIDGLVLGSDQIGHELAVLAGPHEVIVRDGADTVTRREIRVAVGEHAAISVSAVADTSLSSADSVDVDAQNVRASHTDTVATGDRGARRRRLLRNPWLWTGVGAGVIVISAVIFVATFDPRVNDPAQGTTTPPVVRF